MTTYIIRRLIQYLIVLFITTFMLFCVIRFLPGDPILLYVSQNEFSRMTSDAEIEALRHEYGLDKSIPRQYIDWIWAILHGDLGDSIFWGTTVLDEIKSTLPISIYLGIISWILAHAIGIPAGVICAIKRGKWIDTVLTVIGNLGITVPIFWLGIILIYVVGVYLDLLPIQGWTSPFEDFWLSTQQIIMPITCMSVRPLAGTIRFVRSAMLEVWRQDYIRTAWAKGLRERSVIIRHAVRNGFIPIVTLWGMSIPRLFSGMVLIETVFNIPGMGRLAVTALFSQDYAIVQGIALMMCTIVVISNLITDISYAYIDPRVRIEQM